MFALTWISHIAVAGLAIWLGCASANAASANEALPACKFYLSVVDRHGAVSQSEVPHLMDAGEFLGAVYAILNLSQALKESFEFCPPSDAEPEDGVRAVVALVEKKPELGREDFTTVALEALRAKWPCR